MAVAAGREVYRRWGVPGLRAPGPYLDAHVWDQGRCGVRAGLPGTLMASALLLNGGAPDVAEMPETVLGCALEEHTRGAHFGFIRELEWVGVGSVWGRWADDSTVVRSLSLLPLCPHKRDSGQYLCARIADHRGGHDWQLTESWILAQDIGVDEFATARQS
ncbi:hypothetical protein [Streptomyces sp. CA-111067]|uniref:hypothetical protein n=1 Tax=Streptomyces sp. CA-111067 TaxID=3240046 RepID=UPI003D98581F